MVRSTEGEGDRVGTVQVERADPIALTLAAIASRPLPPKARERLHHSIASACTGAAV